MSSDLINLIHILKKADDQTLLENIKHFTNLDEHTKSWLAVAIFYNKNASEKTLLKLLDLKPNLDVIVDDMTTALYAFTRDNITEKVLLKILDLKPDVNFRNKSGDNILYYSFYISEKIVLKVLDLNPILDDEFFTKNFNVSFTVEPRLLAKILKLNPNLSLSTIKKFGTMAKYLIPDKISKKFSELESPELWIDGYIYGDYIHKNKLLHHIPIQVDEFLKKTITKKLYKLYRGYSFTTRKAFSEWFDDEVHQFSNFTKGNTVTLRTKMITSWSFNRSISEGFLVPRIFNTESKSLISVIFYAEIKPSSVFGDISAFDEESNQEEVLIKPSTIKCTLLKILYRGTEVESLYEL